MLPYGTGILFDHVVERYLKKNVDYRIYVKFHNTMSMPTLKLDDGIFLNQTRINTYRLFSDKEKIMYEPSYEYAIYKVDRYRKMKMLTEGIL